VCKNGAECLLRVAENTGIYTMLCTPDDPATTTNNEDTCPDLVRNICGEVPLADGTTEKICLQRCVPKSSGNDCPAELACSISSTRITGKAYTAACLFPACTTADDCPVFLSKTCDAATLTGCSLGEFCEPTGASTAQCALPGSCNATNGLCGPHTKGSATAKIGDPCQQDTECGGAMFCMPEATNAGAVTWRNGYCMIAGCAFPWLIEASCPSGSACHLGYSIGLCLRSCSLTSTTDCRGVTGDLRGDYECYAWNRLPLTGTGQQVAATPLCGTPVPCTVVADCADLGTVTNPTGMSCRDQQTNAPANPGDQGSVCLDNTASGP
jgi:hypothetical protein